MKISKRILYYMIGFGFGLIITIIIFQGRGCEWTPANRVKTSLQNSKMLISNNEKCKLQCSNIPERVIFEMVNLGAVNFSKSDTKNASYTFNFEGMNHTFNVLKYNLSYNDLSLEFWYSKSDSVCILHTVSENENEVSCNCDTLSSNTLSVLYMPNDLIMSTLRAQELWINKEMECQLSCLNLTKNDIVMMLEKGEVLINESFPYRRPNPIYFIKHTINAIDWVFWVEKGATKTRLVHMADMSSIIIKENEYLVNKLFAKIQEENICGCYK